LEIYKNDFMMFGRTSSKPGASLKVEVNAELRPYQIFPKIAVPSTIILN
jgi:hypothetical protein